MAVNINANTTTNIKYVPKEEVELKSADQVNSYKDLPKNFRNRERGLHLFRWAVGQIIFKNNLFKNKALEKYKNWCSEKAIQDRNVVENGTNSCAVDALKQSSVNSEITQIPKALQRKMNAVSDTGAAKDLNNEGTQTQNETDINAVVLPKSQRSEYKPVAIKRTASVAPGISEETKTDSVLSGGLRTEAKLVGQEDAIPTVSSDSFSVNRSKSKSVFERQDENIAVVVDKPQSQDKAEVLAQVAASAKKQLHVDVVNAVNDGIVFGSVPVKSSDEQVLDSYNKLVDFAQDSLFAGARDQNGALVGKDAAKIVINALLVKQFSVNDNKPEGGASFIEKDDDTVDFSRINIALTGDTDDEKKCSESFARFNMACRKARSMLTKHCAGMVQRNLESNGSNIFEQIIDKGSDKNFGSSIDAIKEAYKLKAQSSVESGQSHSLTINSDKPVSSTGKSAGSLIDEADKRHKQKMLRNYYHNVLDKQPEFKEAMLFLAKALLHVEGVAETVEENGIKDFNKIYIPDNISTNGEGESLGLSEAIQNATKMIRKHMLHQANMTVMGGKENNVKTGKHIFDQLDGKADYQTKIQISEQFNALLDKALPDNSLSKAKVAENIQNAYNEKGLKNKKKTAQSVAFIAGAGTIVLTPEQEKARDTFEARVGNKRGPVKEGEEALVETLPEEVVKETKGGIALDIDFAPPKAKKPNA